MSDRVPAPEKDELRAEREELAKLVAAQRELIASLQGKNAALESALINHADEIALLKRKLFGARSERGGTNELQLLLGEILADEAVLQKHLDELREQGPDGDDSDQEERSRRTDRSRRDDAI